MKKILICGDSFAADWSSVHREYLGWPNLLALEFSVENRAQAGCSEYKIYKQISRGTVGYDRIIVCHTSPFRIPVETHPLHKTGLHAQSDLIYSDVKDRLPYVREFFQECFWEEHALFVHARTLEQEQRLLNQEHCLHLTMTKWDGFIKPKHMLNFEKLFEQHRGTINHLSPQGNRLVFEHVMEWLQ